MSRLPLLPEAGAHLEQARHNLSLYEKLRDEGCYPDWAVTALFYSALHLVDAQAAQYEYPLGTEPRGQTLLPLAALR